MPSEFNALAVRLECLEQDNAQMKTGFHIAQRRLRVQATLAFFAFLLAMFVSPVHRAAIAQGAGVTLASLYTSVTKLEDRMKVVDTKNKQQDGRMDELQNRITNLPAGPQGPAGTPADMTRVAAVEAKTQYMSVDAIARSTTFSGCNVVVNDGGGTTDTIVLNAAGDGLGNLIVGYNAPGNSYYSSILRTGSHCLIVGDHNNYSSYGGVVFGNDNAISAPYAAVSGGRSNIASNVYSTVSGGSHNTVSGAYGSIAGGINNTASGDFSVIGGGWMNTASGFSSSISGGSNNRASGNMSSVCGGFSNEAWGGCSSVSGGISNTALGGFSSVSGGSIVLQNDTYGWAAGGTIAGTFHNP